MIKPERFYSSEEVSEYLHLSLRTVQRLLKEQRLGAYKIHGQYRIKGLDLLNYLEAQHSSKTPEKKPAHLIHLLNTQALSMEFGKDWLPWIEPHEAHNTSFIEKLALLRQQMVENLGFILPGVQLRDSATLPPDNYRVLLHGVSIFSGSAKTDPAGLDQVFQKLATLVRRYAHEILSRDEVAVILQHLDEERPAVIQEVMHRETGLTAGQLTQILRYLLKEGVSIRHMGRILEGLADQLSTVTQEQRDTNKLAENLRQHLSRQINAPLATSGVIDVITLAPDFETSLKTQLLDQEAVTPFKLLNHLRNALSPLAAPRVLLSPVALRRKLYDCLCRQYPQLHVLSYREISEDYRIREVQRIESPSAEDI